MAILLRDAVPWGRSFDEYRRMFSLTSEDLEGRILGCGDGPAAFNAGMRARGLRAVSCDPVYAHSAPAIGARIAECFDDVMEQTRRNARRFVWDEIPDLDALAERRMTAMREFLADFPEGARQGRYVAASLPDLPFPGDAFDLCLCSHFLFLYEYAFGLDFHVAALTELTRTAPEVRVFPLADMQGDPSRLLKPVLERLETRGLSCRVEQVEYEFQRNVNAMLVITREDHYE